MEGPIYSHSVLAGSKAVHRLNRVSFFFPSYQPVLHLRRTAGTKKYADTVLKKEYT